MSDKLVTLLKQRYAIEQRITQLKSATISESKRDSAQSMYIKLQSALRKVNEEIGNLEHTLTIEHGREIEPDSFDQEMDHEVEMARNELYNLAHHANKLHELLQGVDERQGLEGWVQAKITKATDYIETVWHYLSYEMKHSHEQQDHLGVGEATITPFKPGQDPNDPAVTGQQRAPGAPVPPPPAGQSSATPSSGGSTPGITADGMVKMAKLGPDRKPLGTPLMVKSTDIMGKQKEGYVVIGESASAGASSAGSMGGSPTGFASGGIGMQKRKKKIGEGSGVVHCSQCGKGFSSSGLKPPHHTGFSHCKDHKGMKVVAENIEEAGFNPNISTPTMRARTASRFGHDPDRAATVYKANKYDPKTGLGGYVAPRGDTTDKSNILLQLKSNLDTATGKPLTFQDGSTLAIKPSIARAAIAKIEGMRPVEKHETIKKLMTSKDAFVGFVKGQSESKEEGQGPEFTGYWKGKDKGKPGKKLVGGGP